MHFAIEGGDGEASDNHWKVAVSAQSYLTLDELKRITLSASLILTCGDCGFIRERRRGENSD